MRKQWAHVARMSTGKWDYVVYSRSRDALHCTGTLAEYDTWRQAYNAARAHMTWARWGR